MAGPVQWCSPDNHTCSFVSRPFVKAISGNQAPAEFQRVTECGLRGGCLRPCVDRACSTGGIPSPVRNQPPLHQGNLTNRFLRMLADHRDWLRGSDVVSRIPVVVPRSRVEIFLDKLLPSRQSVSTAHGAKLSQKRTAAPHESLASGPAVFHNFSRMTLALVRSPALPVWAGGCEPGPLPSGARLFAETGLAQIDTSR